MKHVPIPMPVDVTDEAAFPNIAELRRHYASLPPERREQLNREWLDTNPGETA